MKNTLQKEIAVIILFISFSTLLIFAIETLIYFNENSTINKTEFLQKLIWSFVKALVIDTGLVILYFVNKNRLKNNKSIL